MFTKTGVMLIGALISAIAINPRAGGCHGSGHSRAAGGFILLVLKIGLPFFNKMQKSIDNLNRRVQESVANIRVIKSFVREDYERKRFHRAARDLFDITVKASSIMITVMPIMTLIMNVTTIAVLWFGSGQVMTGDMKGGRSDVVQHLYHAYSHVPDDDVHDDYDVFPCEGLL